MRTSLSKIPAPALAGVVREATAAAAAAEIRNCLYSGADMIDLHVSCLEDSNVDTLRGIIGGSSLPVLALHYNMGSKGQPLDLSDEDRVAALLRAVEAGAAGIDMQGYTFHKPSKDAFWGEDRYSFTKDGPKEVVTDEAVIEKQMELIDRVHAAGAEVLLSCHPGVVLKAEQVVELALFMEQRQPDIIKIVSVAKTEEDMAESIRAMIALKKEVRTPVAYHANGAAGSLSRVVNPVLGGQIAFCVDRYKEGSTLEQPDLRTVRTIVDNLKKIR